MTSFSEENYLKAIFHLEKKTPTGVSTNSLAEQLETKPSSVSDMIRKLAQKKLVAYRKYKGVNLSEKGKKTALEVIRKHRLWEFFLVEKLKFNWAEVHEVAEQLEHIQSDKLIRELDKFLGYPTEDPHGDPIPDVEGNIQSVEKILLSDVVPGETGICVGVRNSSKLFLGFLDKHHIALGKQIKVLEKENFDQSMLIELDAVEVRISKAIANNLYVKIV